MMASIFSFPHASFRDCCDDEGNCKSWGPRRVSGSPTTRNEREPRESADHAGAVPETEAARRSRRPASNRQEGAASSPQHTKERAHAGSLAHNAEEPQATFACGSPIIDPRRPRASGQHCARGTAAAPVLRRRKPVPWQSCLAALRLVAFAGPERPPIRFVVAKLETGQQAVGDLVRHARRDFPQRHAGALPGALTRVRDRRCPRTLRSSSKRTTRSSTCRSHTRNPKPRHVRWPSVYSRKARRVDTMGIPVRIRHVVLRPRLISRMNLRSSVTSSVDTERSSPSWTFHCPAAPHRR